MVGVVDALLLLPLHLGLRLGLQPLLDEVVLGEVEGDGLVLVERILIKPETLNFLHQNHLDVLQQQVDHCEVNCNEAVTSIFSHYNSTKILV